MSETAKKPKPKGRKVRLTRQMIELIEKSLTSHNTKRTTCQMVGISESTLYRWLEDGETARSGLKRDLWEAVNKAQSISKTILVSQIGKDPNWQAKAWLLERMHPEEYGRRQRVNHTTGTGDDEQPLPAATMPAPIVNVVVQKSDDEESPWVDKTNEG